MIFQLSLFEFIFDDEIDIFSEHNLRKIAQPIHYKSFCRSFIWCSTLLPLIEAFHLWWRCVLSFWVIPSKYCLSTKYIKIKANSCKAFYSSPRSYLGVYVCILNTFICRNSPLIWYVLNIVFKISRRMVIFGLEKF